MIRVCVRPGLGRRFGYDSSEVHLRVFWSWKCFVCVGASHVSRDRAGMCLVGSAI